MLGFYTYLLSALLSIVFGLIAHYYPLYQEYLKLIEQNCPFTYIDPYTIVTPEYLDQLRKDFILEGIMKEDTPSLKPFPPSIQFISNFGSAKPKYLKVNIRQYYLDRMPLEWIVPYSEITGNTPD